MINLRQFMLLTIIVIASFISGCGNEQNSSAKNTFKQEFKSMLVYPKKNLIAEFSLLDQHSAQFNQESLKGAWNLIFMGYTYCPDVCPATLTDITKIYQKIPAELQKKFRIIFLSVDPVRDTPEHLAQYLDYFHPEFVGISGEKDQIDSFVHSLGGIYSLNQEEGEFYSVDHSGRIFIVNPKGERYGIITSETMHNKDKSELVNELGILAESE